MLKNKNDQNREFSILELEQNGERIDLWVEIPNGNRWCLLTIEECSDDKIYLTLSEDIEDNEYIHTDECGCVLTQKTCGCDMGYFNSEDL